MLVMSASAQNGETRSPPAAEMHAAVLRAMVVLKLAPYLVVDPPPAVRKEYRIGVVGSDIVATALLKELPGKKVGELPVVVVAIDPADASKDTPAHSCDLLWVGQSVDRAAEKRIVAVHATQPVVMVSGRPGFAALGGSVQLFVQDNGIKFEVNVDTLKPKGIRANPNLLKLSRKGPTE